MRKISRYAPLPMHIRNGVLFFACVSFLVTGEADESGLAGNYFRGK